MTVPLTVMLSEHARVMRGRSIDERAADLAATVTKMRSEGARRLEASGLDVEVGPPYENEMRFVHDCTAKTRWPHRDVDRPISWDGWCAIFGPRIAEMLRDGRVLVATATHEGTRVALGFVVWEAFDVLTMLYVKKAYRGAGIGIKLLEASGVGMPIKVLAETAPWRRWVKYHGIQTRRVEERDLAEWKRARTVEDRKIVLGVTGYDRTQVTTEPDVTSGEAE